MSGNRRGTFPPPLTKLSVIANTVLASRQRYVTGMALALVRQIKLELSTPGKGRIRKHKTGGKKSARRSTFDPTNRASIAGDPPAPDSGRLRNSIAYEHTAHDVVRVGTSVSYAAALEFGTRSAGRSHNVTILPRPFMRPALAKCRPLLQRFVTAGLQATVKGASGGV